MAGYSSHHSLCPCLALAHWSPWSVSPFDSVIRRMVGSIPLVLLDYEFNRASFRQVLICLDYSHCSTCSTINVLDVALTDDTLFQCFARVNRLSISVVISVSTLLFALNGLIGLDSSMVVSSKFFVCLGNTSFGSSPCPSPLYIGLRIRESLFDWDRWLLIVKKSSSDFTLGAEQGLW